MFFVLFQPIIQKKIFFYRFLGPIFSRSVPPFWSHGALSDATGEAFGGLVYPASGEMHSRRLWAAAQVGAVGGAGRCGGWRRSVRWVAQVGAVSGAGRCGEWRRSVR